MPTPLTVIPPRLVHRVTILVFQDIFLFWGAHSSGLLFQMIRAWFRQADQALSGAQIETVEIDFFPSVEKWIPYSDIESIAVNPRR